MLKKNLKFASEASNISKVLCVPQNHNLEDELEYSRSNIQTVTEITRSRSRSDFKRDFLKSRNICSLLIRAGFDFELLWSKEPHGEYQNIGNHADALRRKDRKR